MKSNIRRLLFLVQENKENPLVLVFLALYPAPLWMAYFLVTRVEITFLTAVFAYLGAIALFILRLSANKIMLTAGWIISGHNPKQTEIWTYFLDYLGTIFWLTCFFRLSLQDSCALTLFILIYEFLILFQRPLPKWPSNN